MTKDELANLLAIAAYIYRNRDIHAMSKEIQNDDVVRLHEYGILSTNALAAIVGISKYRVGKAIEGLGYPPARGDLNPAHLTMLLYSLSKGEIPDRWLEEMVNNGTSISTISALTGISESTIYYWRSK